MNIVRLNDDGSVRGVINRDLSETSALKFMQAWQHYFENQNWNCAIVKGHERYFSRDR